MFPIGGLLLLVFFNKNICLLLNSVYKIDFRLIFLAKIIGWFIIGQNNVHLNLIPFRLAIPQDLSNVFLQR